MANKADMANTASKASMAGKAGIGQQRPTKPIWSTRPKIAARSPCSIGSIRLGYPRSS